jgi:hypothetical protein
LILKIPKKTLRQTQQIQKIFPAKDHYSPETGALVPINLKLFQSKYLHPMKVLRIQATAYHLTLQM